MSHHSGCGDDEKALAVLELITAANRGERFLLNDDPTVLPPDLDNEIHSIFAKQNFLGLISPLATDYDDLTPSLRFASMFLQHDSILQWFLRPAFGHTLIDPESGCHYLSYPCRDQMDKSHMLNEVRKALNCLAHSIEFTFDLSNDSYAETRLHAARKPPHTDQCSSVFLRNSKRRWDYTVRIRINGSLRDFVNRHHPHNGLCEKLRFDFHFATVLLHEVTHAFGVLMRGDLIESRIHVSDPKHEWGFSFEDFALGGITNPICPVTTKVSCFMRREWLCQGTTSKEGKLWDIIPMAWIGQWFQKSTWTAIALEGPGVIPPPISGLRVQVVAVDGMDRYTVFANCQEAIDDVLVRQQWWYAQYKVGREATPKMGYICHAEKINTQSHRRLQVYKRRVYREPDLVFSVAGLPLPLQTVQPVPQRRHQIWTVFKRAPQALALPKARQAKVVKTKVSARNGYSKSLGVKVA